MDDISKVAALPANYLATTIENRQYIITTIEEDPRYPRHFGGAHIKLSIFNPHKPELENHKWITSTISEDEFKTLVSKKFGVDKTDLFRFY